MSADTATLNPLPCFFYDRSINQSVCTDKTCSEHIYEQLYVKSRQQKKICVETKLSLQSCMRSRHFDHNGSKMFPNCREASNTKAPSQKEKITKRKPKFGHRRYSIKYIVQEQNRKRTRDKCGLPIHKNDKVH